MPQAQPRPAGPNVRMPAAAFPKSMDAPDGSPASASLRPRAVSGAARSGGAEGSPTSVGYKPSPARGPKGARSPAYTPMAGSPMAAVPQTPEWWPAAAPNFPVPAAAMWGAVNPAWMLPAGTGGGLTEQQAAMLAASGYNPYQPLEPLYALPEMADDGRFQYGGFKGHQPQWSNQQKGSAKGKGKDKNQGKGGKQLVQKTATGKGHQSSWLGKGLGGMVQNAAIKSGGKAAGKSQQSQQDGGVGKGQQPVDPSVKTATLPKPVPKTAEGEEPGAPAPPPSGWTVLWCDEMAFKAISQPKRDELEGMGIRVKAHKTAERCIRSLDKRAKKLTMQPPLTPGGSPAPPPKTIALVTEESHEVIPYLNDRPFLARHVVLVASPGKEDQRLKRFTEVPIVKKVVPTWEEGVTVISEIIEECKDEPDDPVSDLENPSPKKPEVVSA